MRNPLASLCVLAFVACSPAPTTPEASTAQAEPAHPAATPEVSSRSPQYREFKDFVVGCDNTGSCKAVGVPAKSETDMYLVLGRDAGAQGKLELQLVGTGSAALQAKQLTVDGKPSPISGLAWKATDDGALTLDDPALVASFLSQIHNAKSIGSSADKGNSVSLEGLDASLLFIDEQQGRLNTTTALAQPGNGAADQVPAATPAPVLPPQAAAVEALTAAQSSQLLRAVRTQSANELKAAGCSTDPATADDADDASRLTAADALVFIACNDGAYQSDFLMYRAPIDGKPATRLVLPPLAFKADSTDSVTFDTLVDADYDPKTATLSYSNKGRGVGDCGDSATWRFDGNNFVLASYSSLNRCGGVLPDDWPVYWRTAAAAQ